MRRIPIITLALCFASAAVADGTTKGAKALFVDSTSGTTIQSHAQAPAKVRPPGNRPTGKKPDKQKQATQPVPEISGLMYYVELVSPSGETSRVTTDRVFRSGERILLHVVSSIDGDIEVHQRTPNGHARLFPDDRIANGSGRIVKGVDTILPSPTSWFRFDSQAGTEELMLILRPRSAPADPQRPDVPSQTMLARYDEIGPVAGSKGLVVETEDKGPEQATYVVRRIENGLPPEPVIVRIQLQHR